VSEDEIWGDRPPSMRLNEPMPQQTEETPILTETVFMDRNPVLKQQLIGALDMYSEQIIPHGEVPRLTALRDDMLEEYLRPFKSELRGRFIRELVYKGVEVTVDDSTPRGLVMRAKLNLPYVYDEKMKDLQSMLGRAKAYGVNQNSRIIRMADEKMRLEDELRLAQLPWWVKLWRYIWGD